MLSLSDTSKKIMMIIITFFLIESCVSLIYFKLTPVGKSIVYGLLICSLCSLLKLILLDKAVQKSIDMEKKDAIKYMNKHYFFRQLITILIFVFVATKHPKINFFGGAIGLLNLKFAAQSIKIFFKN